MFHVPAAIANQLRRVGVDVLTAQDDAASELIAKATYPADWLGQVEQLPLR